MARPVSVKRVTLWFCAVFIGIALLVLLVGPKLIRFWRGDSCLDHGGAYNYDAGQCEFGEDRNKQ